MTKEGESGKAEDENDDYDAGLMDKPETELESVTSAGIGRPHGSAGMVSRTVERSARIAPRSVSRAKRKAAGVTVPPCWQFPQGSKL